MGREEKVEKRKLDETKENNSPSDDDNSENEERKKRKLEKKLEKLNRKIQKREQQSSSVPEIPNATSSATIEKLTMNDYYRKSQEFRLWLLNNKKLRMEDDLENTEEIQHYFKKFIKKWNSGKLSSKYYSKTGVHSSELSHQQRTSYSWNLKNLTQDEELQLELTRDRVDTNTFENSWKEENAQQQTKQ